VNAHEPLDEPILDAGLPIVDAHHHLWDHGGPDRAPAPDCHPLLAMTAVRSRYLAAELAADLASGHAVKATVYVQSGPGFYFSQGPDELRPVGETVHARKAGEAALASTGLAMCAAIVGFADLSLGDRVQPVLEAHLEAGGGRFRGIRNGMAWDADPAVMGPFAGRQGLYASNGFRQGLRRLADFGLSFDAWLLEPQLPDLLDLARAVPDALIILDHLGAPLGLGAYAGRQDERFPIWRGLLRNLAACDNVVVKLGGLGMPLAGLGTFGRTCSSVELAQLWFPYFETCIEIFGPRRCMLESNFPAEAGSCSYRILWNSFKIICNKFSETEKADLFHGTAARAYRLKMAALPSAQDERVEV